ncbi:HAD-IIB family hydrolase [Alteromonas sp. 5E99-2]|nr:HAD-IIB family hydrolase [Alteromonas sp. 5E99-2]
MPLSTIAPESIIYTDMDGTLLDHDTYSIDPAKALLEKLQVNGIPVIPNTSKTFAELLSLRKKHNLTGPFIVENGAAVYIPHGFLPKKPAGALWSDGYWCKSFSSSRSHWLQLVEGMSKRFNGKYVGFSKMSLDDIADATGLALDDAKLSSQRQYGEPVLFTGNDEEKADFISGLKIRGATILEGGRFIHVCGNVNKGMAMNWLTDIVKSQFNLPASPRKIALGDSGNDIAMLQEADIGIRIRTHVKPPPDIPNAKGEIITSTKVGPEGWSETLSTLFTFS